MQLRGKTQNRKISRLWRQTMMEEGVTTVVHLDHLPGSFFGPSNLVELLLHRARCQPEDIAFSYLVDGENEEVHLTYRELDRRARAIGAWLEANDLVGERALLLYPPGLRCSVLRLSLRGSCGGPRLSAASEPVDESDPVHRRRRRSQGCPDNESGF
jgi:hypothetical protein